MYWLFNILNYWTIGLTLNFLNENKHKDIFSPNANFTWAISIEICPDGLTFK